MNWIKKLLFYIFSPLIAVLFTLFVLELFLIYDNSYTQPKIKEIELYGYKYPFIDRDGIDLFEKNKIDNLHITNRHRITFSTHTKNIKVHMRPEIAQKSFENLVLALGVIEKNEKNLSEIDLSFKNKIVIKHENEVKKKI